MLFRSKCKMTGKSKFDYEVENFISSFQKYKDRKIVLYGTGRMTATLLDRIKGFQIIGLCDRDGYVNGKEIYGLPLLKREEAERQADMMIINTSATYWGTIYQRIKDWEIPIYYLNGEMAVEEKDEEASDTYWDRSYNELKKMISEQDIISFDIFDTLVMRKVMLPMDVFRLAEIRLDKERPDKTDFMTVRKKASGLLTDPTLDEIYLKMSELTGKPQEELEKWKKKEIDTEEKLLISREDMVQLCRETLEEKEVYFISDMYYSSEILQEILWKICRLHVDKNRIIVSCEQKKTKQDGSLWEYYKKNIAGEKRALHIGDNEIGDIQRAREYGIDAYHVMGACQMLRKSSIRAVAPVIESLYSSLAMGLICTKVFNSPFALKDTQGKLRFRDEKEAGYVLLGSLMYSFMFWLVGEVRHTAIKKLVFFSREGYLMIPIYNHLKALLGGGFPEAVYLKISRRAVWNASISEKEDVDEIAEFPYVGTYRMFLRERFGINIAEEGLSGISIDKIAGEAGRAKQMLNTFYEKILKRSSEEKRNYLAYLSTLDLSEKYAVVDSQFYGSTQYYLGKILHRRLTGYYFCACLEEDNSYLSGNEMHGCFQGDSNTKAKDTNVHRQAQFLESFFTSPEGMLEYVDSNGRERHAEKMLNQKNFSIRFEMTEGIKEFIGQMFSLQRALDIEQKDDMWSDHLFGCLMNGGFIPSENMKKSFYFDNNITGSREVPIWE